jgi:hypothetical protein
MPKGNRGKRKADPLELRFHLLVRKDIAKTLTAERYNQVYREWVQTGKLPPGFRVPPNAIEWRNPARRGSLRNWRSGDNEEAINTLAERALPVTNFKI